MIKSQTRISKKEAQLRLCTYSKEKGRQSFFIEMKDTCFDLVNKILKVALLNDNFAVRWSGLRELVEIAKADPKKVSFIVKDLLDYFHSPTSKSNHLLVKLGGKNSRLVIPILSLAFQQNDYELQWEAIQQLIELANHQPCQCLESLELAAKASNPHVQWAASTKIEQLKIKYKLTNSMCQQLSNDITLAIHEKIPYYDFVRKVIDGVFNQIPRETNLDNLLSIEELPLGSIPILEQFLLSNDPDEQWIALLLLIELHEEYPELIKPIFNKAFRENQSEVIEGVKSLLIEASKTDLSRVLIILDLALREPDTGIQWQAIYELLQLSLIHPKEAWYLLDRAVKDSRDSVKLTSNRLLVEVGKSNPDLVAAFLGTINKQNT